MKQTLGRIVGGALLTLVFVVSPCVGQESPNEASAKKRFALARLDEQIARKTRELKDRIMEGYLDYLETTRTVAPVMNYPGLNYRALCDSVPEIAALDKAWREADEAYTAVLKSDRKYAAIRREYVALNGVDDKARTAANKEKYNLLYARLRKNNSAYEPAWKRRQAAMAQRNAGVVRALFEHYRARQAVMPTEPLFAKYSQPMSGIRAACPEIATLEREIATLTSLRGEVYEQYMRETLGVPKAGSAGRKIFRP